MNAMPGRPVDVRADVSLRDLLDAYHRHTSRLVDARHGLGEPLPAPVLAGHAVAVLAVQHAIAERVLHSRWVNAVAALTHGATLAQVAAGMGLDEDEVRFGLRSWADGQHQQGLITEDEHDSVGALIADDAEEER